MIEFLVWLVMKIISSAPAAIASLTAYCTSGLSTTGRISLALALVAGKNRVPRPATGNTAFRMRMRGSFYFTALQIIPVYSKVTDVTLKKNLIGARLGQYERGTGRVQVIAQIDHSRQKNGLFEVDAELASRR